MKKIISLALCLVVGVTVMTGCSEGDEPFVQNSYTAEAAEITGVYIDVRDREIEVSLSADNQIHIDYYENSKEYYDISISDDNVLTMTTASNKEWTDYIGGKTAAGSRKISLQVPESLLTVLKLSTTNEDILLPALTILEDVELTSTGGDIIFDKLNVGKTILINAKNGDISGSIIGSYDEYAVFCDIKKGESNLPTEKNDGDKTLSVSNNNGDIGIDFITE